MKDLNIHHTFEQHDGAVAHCCIVYVQLALIRLPLCYILFIRKSHIRTVYLAHLQTIYILVELLSSTGYRMRCRRITAGNGEINYRMQLLRKLASRPTCREILSLSTHTMFIYYECVVKPNNIISKPSYAETGIACDVANSTQRCNIIGFLYALMQVLETTLYWALSAQVHKLLLTTSNTCKLKYIAVVL